MDLLLRKPKRRDPLNQLNQCLAGDLFSFGYKDLHIDTPKGFHYQSIIVFQIWNL